MHEMALAEEVLQIVQDAARREGLRRVVALWLEIGQLSSVEPEAMRFCFEAVARDSVAALHGLVAAMVQAVPGIRCLRDPTRGGLATTLNEFACQSGAGIRIVESAIPVREQVSAACELLGLDPLYVANEGKLVAVCAPQDAKRLLAAMRAHPLGRDAAQIGEVTEDAHRFVQMQTAFGGARMVDWLSGEQLPRIC